MNSLSVALVVGSNSRKYMAKYDDVMYLVVGKEIVRLPLVFMVLFNIASGGLR
jgi:hypothetical protein